MKIKKGDKVIVISGAYKGKTGVVQKAHPSLDKVVVEGVNPEGSIVDVYAPIHVSNVALIDPKTKKATRVGSMVDKKGKKVRVSTAKAGRNKLD